jgi:hypothetical protein
MSNASARAETPGLAESRSSCRNLIPKEVAPGSEVSATFGSPIHWASNLACVLLPHPSMPSSAISRPRTPAPD